MMITVRDVQQRLADLGFNPGAIDGIRGKRTIVAVRKFQASRGLTVDGIVGRQTLASLFPTVLRQAQDEAVSPPDRFPWLTEGLRVMGWHEVEDNARLREWLKSDGPTLGDPKKLPWCGDFVETCILRSLPDESVPGNPYWARNWASWGVACEPQPGAVLVFARGNAGHVGFYVGETATHFVVLGGNQSDRVSKAKIAKSRLLACRWPETFLKPAGGRLMADGSGLGSTTNEA